MPARVSTGTKRQIRDIVFLQHALRMECALVFALEHDLEPGRIGHAKDAVSIRTFVRSADDRDRFGQQALVRRVSVQIERGEKDALSRVRVDLHEQVGGQEL